MELDGQLAAAQKEIGALKKKVATYSLVALLLGSSGVFGIFTYFVERPLKAENEQLSSKMKHAELDNREQEMIVRNYNERIKSLEQQINLSEKLLNPEEQQRLKSRLLDTHALLEQDLRELQENLRQLAGGNSRWFTDNFSADSRRSVSIAKRVLGSSKELIRAADQISATRKPNATLLGR